MANLNQVDQSSLSFRIYSDASIRYGICGYSFVVVNPARDIVAERNGTCKTKISIEGELTATLQALREIPDGSRVQIYSDLKDIKKFISKEIGSPTVQDIVTEINTQIKRMVDCTFYFVEKKSRSHYYHACHGAARFAAKNAIRLRNISPEEFKKQLSMERFLSKQFKRQLERVGVKFFKASIYFKLVPHSFVFFHAGDKSRRDWEDDLKSFKGFVNDPGLSGRNGWADDQLQIELFQHLTELGYYSIDELIEDNVDLTMKADFKRFTIIDTNQVKEFKPEGNNGR